MVISVESVLRTYKRVQSEDETEYSGVQQSTEQQSEENWVSFSRWQSKVIEKKWQEKN
jgi:hypothetical protein